MRNARRRTLNVHNVLVAPIVVARLNREASTCLNRNKEPRVNQFKHNRINIIPLHQRLTACDTYIGNVELFDLTHQSFNGHPLAVLLVLRLVTEGATHIASVQTNKGARETCVSGLTLNSGENLMDNQRITHHISPLNSA
jgi:hypothetical protein